MSVQRKLKFYNVASSVKVLGKGAFVTIDPPINGQTIFRGNSFNSAKAPPKTVEFPHDHPVKVCF